MEYILVTQTVIWPSKSQYKLTEHTCHQMTCRQPATGWPFRTSFNSCFKICLGENSEGDNMAARPFCSWRNGPQEATVQRVSNLVTRGHHSCGPHHYLATNLTQANRSCPTVGLMSLLSLLLLWLSRMVMLIIIMLLMMFMLMVLLLFSMNSTWWPVGARLPKGGSHRN